MKPFNNKLLAIILLLLIGLFVFAKYFRAPGRESNMQTMLFRVDTSKISEVDINPRKTGGKQIKIVRQSGKWQVLFDQYKALPPLSPVQNLLGSLTNMSIQRVMSKKKEKWDDYRVGDTSGTHVVVYAGKENLAEYWIGEGSSAGMYGGKQSYIRMKGQEDVYAVEGYLNSLFNKSFDDWRDKSFLSINKNEVISIGFSGSINFMIKRKDSLWTIDSKKADADSVNRYLSKWQFKYLTTFADDFSPSEKPDLTIVIADAAGSIITVKGWKQKEGNWILHSSQHPDSYFSVDENEVGRDFRWQPVAFIKN